MRSYPSIHLPTLRSYGGHSGRTEEINHSKFNTIDRINFWIDDRASLKKEAFCYTKIIYIFNELMTNPLI